MKEMLKSKSMILFIIIVLVFVLIEGITTQKNTSAETTDNYVFLQN